MPQADSVSGASVPGKTRQTVVCDGLQSPEVTANPKISHVVSTSINLPDSQMKLGPGGPRGNTQHLGSAREKNIAPTSKIMAK